MNLLLDTHAFIWWAIDPNKLSQTARLACEDATNQLVFSIASVWEMQIKLQLKKLNLNKPLDQLVDHQISRNGLQLLPIELPHIYALDVLPQHHRDPFDRLIIAQASSEHLTVVSADSVFSTYSIPVLW